MPQTYGDTADRLCSIADGLKTMAASLRDKDFHSVLRAAYGINDLIYAKDALAECIANINSELEDAGYIVVTPDGLKERGNNVK
jgi:hypothetical protein